MTMSLHMITFDCYDALTLATWWARYVSGVVHQNDDASFVTVTADGLTLGFQQVAEPTPGKNRLHLDLAVGDRRTVRDLLLADGARLVADHEDSSFCWTVLADPEGNQFCIMQHNGA